LAVAAPPEVPAELPELEAVVVVVVLVVGVVLAVVVPPVLVEPQVPGMV